jgi:hypothetical protein
MTSKSQSVVVKALTHKLAGKLPGNLPRRLFTFAAIFTWLVLFLAENPATA